ncbi:MAG TPA: hypothetical protein VFF67_01005 [Thermoplasmata archaeon]|nr:hypothetical protein [Thermoplasmata archaeon]
MTFGTITISPPFHKATWSANNQVFSTCTTKAHLGVLPHWSNATGVGGWISTSSSKTCPVTVGGISDGWASTILTLAIPVRIPTGAHSVQLNLNIAATASQSAHIGKTCPAPRLNANGNGAEFCLITAEWCFPSCFNPNPTYLWDSTNNTYTTSSTSLPSYYNYTYDYNQTSCSSYKCTYSNYSSAAATSGTGNGFKAPFTWYFNTTAVKGHQYWVVVSINGYAMSEVENYPASTAAANLNVDTFGNGLNFTSIKIV